MFWVTCLAYSRWGETLASGSYDGVVRLWRMPDGREVAQLAPARTRITSLVYRPPDGDGLVAASGGCPGDNAVRLWPSVNKAPEQVQSLLDFSSVPLSLAWSREGQLLAGTNAGWAPEENIIWLWSLDGKELRKFQGANFRAFCLAWSPSEDILAIGSGGWNSEHTVRLVRFNAQGGTQRLWVGAHEQAVAGVAFSPDGSLLASGSHDGIVRIWQVGDGALLETLAGHTAAVTSVAWSPDGQALASGSSDKTVRVWRIGNGQPARVLYGHTNQVTCVAWSPVGEKLASGSRDSAVHIWHL
jgi:WD40 repeat protein